MRGIVPKIRKFWGDVKAGRGALVLLLLSVGSQVSGQMFYRDHHTAAGAGGGLLMFFGDIGSMGTGYNATLEVTHAFGNEWGGRVRFLLAEASDSDEGTPNASRGYVFSTVMRGMALQGSYLFYRKVERGTTRQGLLRYWNRWQAELLGGPGILYYKVTPGGRLNEGNMTRTQGYAMYLPLGVGITYGLLSDLAVRGEISPVFLLSDSIDGYASPHSRSSDFMYSVSLSVIYTIMP